jgi:hypothetical protein
MRSSLEGIVIYPPEENKGYYWSTLPNSMRKAKIAAFRASVCLSLHLLCQEKVEHVQDLL